MNSIHGGIKNGELGVIASPSGIGKTSVLVQIALDKLLQGKKVIHVSFTQHTDYVLSWYEDIFDEFIQKKNLENREEVKNEIVKNRVLMKFNQEGTTVDQILKSLRALIKDGGFNAESVIIDGLDFAATGQAHIAAFKAFAVEMGISVWYSCTVAGGEPLYDKRNIPLAIKDYA
jgi:KaiC/GvpD/RAD55 family RecA-like ATPase